MSKSSKVAGELDHLNFLWTLARGTPTPYRIKAVPGGLAIYEEHNNRLIRISPQGTERPGKILAELSKLQALLRKGLRKKEMEK